MTIDQAVARCDSVKPNQYSREDKVRWLSEADGQIRREILDPWEGQEDFDGYDEDTPGTTQLLAPETYCGLYEAYLSARIDFCNGEFTRYQNSAQLYNALFGNLADWYRRTHLPLQENAITL